MEKGYRLKKFRLDKLKITVSISNCKKTVFNCVSCKKPLKAPGNLMVTMVTKRKIFDQLYLLRHSRMNLYLTKISRSKVNGVMR